MGTTENKPPERRELEEWLQKVDELLKEQEEGEQT